MACEKVFSIPELRERILNYVIYDNAWGHNLSPKDIVSCRQMNRAWLQSTSHCIAQSKKFILHFHLTQRGAQYTFCDDNLITQLPLQHEQDELGVSLAKFVELGADARQQNRDMFPPFSLAVYKDFLKPENQAILWQLLTNCASGLIEIQLNFISASENSVQFSFPDMPHLPKLRKLDVASTKLDSVEQEHAETWIQSTLNASDNLQIACYESFDRRDEICLEKMRLPPNLTTIYLVVSSKQSAWQVLTRTPLPNLTSLELISSYCSLGSTEIMKILEHVSATLGTFKLVSRVKAAVLAVPLPVMKKLKHLELSNAVGQVRIQPGKLSVQECLPNLGSFTLKSDEVEVIGLSPCVSVYKEVSLEFNLWHNWEDIGTQQVDIVRRIFQVFPNLQKLKITGDVDVGVVRCAFQELPHLTHLHIGLRNEDKLVLNSAMLDALLVGLPHELMESLREDPKRWETADLREDALSSIRNLTKLESLILETCGDGKKGNALISDAVFHQAFLKMPNLHALSFGGRIQVADEMAQKWRELGKEINFLKEEER